MNVFAAQRGYFGRANGKPPVISCDEERQRYRERSKSEQGRIIIVSPVGPVRLRPHRSHAPHTWRRTDLRYDHIAIASPPAPHGDSGARGIPSNRRITSNLRIPHREGVSGPRRAAQKRRATADHSWATDKAHEGPRTRAAPATASKATRESGGGDACRGRPVRGRARASVRRTAGQKNARKTPPLRPPKEEDEAEVQGEGPGPPERAGHDRHLPHRTA
ncbi:hypothetical protein BOBR111200_17105 [Bordetella bronchialis]